MDPEIGAGKEMILELVKDELRRRKAGIEDVVFEWRDEVESGYLVLKVLKGKTPHLLRFFKADVADWPSTQEMPGKYRARILGSVEELLEQ